MKPVQADPAMKRAMTEALKEPDRRRSKEAVAIVIALVIFAGLLVGLRALVMHDWQGDAIEKSRARTSQPQR
jgi:hypothetical protein